MPLDLLEPVVLKSIQDEVSKNGLSKTARKRGIAISVLWDVVHKRRAISAEVATKFGYVRERIVLISFRKVQGDK